jgi:hypothetical protein
MENNDPYNGPLTEEELGNALHDCKITSPGPDDIHYEFLKRMDTKTYGAKENSQKNGEGQRSSRE